jgi:probable rRNA maturation factor
VSSSRKDTRLTEIHLISHHPDGSPDLARLENLARRVLKREKWQFAVTVIITGDEELRKINRSFLGSDNYTDVVAFPPYDEKDPIGEIYVSLDQAQIQAREENEPVQRAVERLMVHGILHLGGWSDHTNAEREKMLEHGEHYLDG